MLSESSTEFPERQRQREEEYLVILKMDAGVTAHEQAWPLACGERLKQINFVVCKIYTNETEKVTKERKKREKERERGKDGRPSSPETPLSLPCSAQKSKPKPIGWRVVEAAEGELRRGHPK